MFYYLNTLAMKKIKFNGTPYYYKVILGGGNNDTTEIYSFYETVEVKCGFLWLKKKRVPKFLVDVFLDVENPHIPPKEIMKAIHKAFKLDDRIKAIQNGDIL